MVYKGTCSEQHLSCSDKQGEDDGPHPDPKHTVNEKASEEAEDDIGPRVPGIEAHEGALRDVQGLDHCVLKGGRVVIAEVAPKAEEAHDGQHQVSMQGTVGVACHGSSTSLQNFLLPIVSLIHCSQQGLLF